MPMNKFSHILCISLAALCLMAGFYMVSFPVLTWLTLGLAPAWYWFGKNKIMEWFSFLFFIFLGLAITGLMLGVNFWLMLVSTCFSLAAWDLLFFNRSFSGCSQGTGFSLYLKKHYLSLVGVVMCSLVFIAIGRFFSLSIPFWGMLFLAFLLILGTDRLGKNIKKV